jgi:hypothetical protein
MAVHGISWVIGVRAQLRSHNVEDTSLRSNANNGSNESWRKGVRVQLRLGVQPVHSLPEAVRVRLPYLEE